MESLLSNNGKCRKKMKILCLILIYFSRRILKKLITLYILFHFYIIEMGGKKTFLRLDAKIRNCVRTRVNAQPKENKEKK